LIEIPFSCRLSLSASNSGIHFNYLVKTKLEKQRKANNSEKVEISNRNCVGQKGKKMRRLCHVSRQVVGSSDVVLIDGNEIILNRPGKLNSLNLEMVRMLQLGYLKFRDSVVMLRGEGKAFCAGGDIVAIREDVLSGSRRRLANDFFYEEYELNHFIATMLEVRNVAQVSLWNGVTMGGGVGLSLHGPYRVCTEKTMFAMPETSIGLIPDVGGTYALGRLSCTASGMYAGLTGHRLKASDCMRLGLGTHFVSEKRLDGLVEKLKTSSIREVGDVLDSYCHEEVSGSSVLNEAEIIRCFSDVNSVEEILERVERSEYEDWKIEALRALKNASPLSLKLTFKAINLHKNLTIGEALINEYRIVQRLCAVDGEFFEGIRAVLVDKDRNCKWNYAGLNDVSDELVDSFFAPLINHPRGDLKFN